MKFSFFLITLFIASFAGAQSTDFIASTGGIGPIKIGISKAAVEKILGIKIKLPKSEMEQQAYEMDSIKCKYKELDLNIVFYKTYFGNDTGARTGVYLVECKSPLVKTKSGIVIGDDKLKIFKTYDQYRLEYYPDWDRKLNPKKAQINLFDNESPNVLTFYLYDGIVTGFSATIFEGD